MSKDDETEQKLYDAIEEVARIPRPKERERIFNTAVNAIATFMKWNRR